MPEHRQPPPLPRHLLSDLRRGLGCCQIAYVIGPRRTGKTTLVRDLLGGGRYFTLDDAEVLEALRADPKGQLLSLAAGGAPVVLDGIHKLRDLTLPLKVIADANRSSGQFLLTAPANIFLLPDSADSLCGRIWTSNLRPLTMSEIRRRPASRLLDWAVQEAPDIAQIEKPEPFARRDYIEAILRGGFPEALELDPASRARWHREQADAMVYKDIAGLRAIRRPAVLRALLAEMAARTAAEENTESLTEAIKASRQTVERYLYLLEQMLLVFRLPAWDVDENLRGIGRAKRYFLDTGMACSLRELNAASFRLGPDAAELGPLAETFVYHELQRALELQKTRFRLYHWRSRDRQAISILASSGGAMVGIKVKASRSYDPKDFAHLDAFESKGLAGGRRFTGIVLYTGDSAHRIRARRFLLPISALWSRIVGAQQDLF